MDALGKSARLSVARPSAPPFLTRLQKPHGIEAVRALFPGAADDELIFVGDRFFTDILFGNTHGMLTVYVEPFTSKGDNPMVRIIRSSEAALVQQWEKRGALAPPHRLFSEDLFATTK